MKRILTALACSCAFAFACNAQMTAARMMAFAQTGGALSAKSYVQDGLVAMWDGIENAAYGKHDTSVRYWKDLVRGTECEFSKDETPNWGNNCWTSVSSTDEKYFIASWPDGIATNHTIEVLIKKTVELRGTIIGAFSISGGNYCSAEWYTGRNFRMYYHGNPDAHSTSYSFPTNVIKYFSILHSGNNYKIIDNNLNVLKDLINPYHNLKTSVSHIGCDGRTTSMCFNGSIFAIRIYNRAISDEEISSNYAVDKARFNLP